MHIVREKHVITSLSLLRKIL